MTFLGSRFGLFTLAAVFLIQGNFLLAGNPQEASSKAYREAYSAMLEERWKEAEPQFESLVQLYPKSDWADDARFWLCFIKEKEKQDLESCFDCYRSFIHGNKSSEWADDAKRHLVRLGLEMAKQGKPEYRKMVEDYRRSNDAEIVLTALAALSNIGDDKSLSIILERFRETTNPKLREKMLRILDDHLKSEKVRTAISQTAQNDSSPRVRAKAVEALNDWKSPEAAELFKKIAMQDEAPSVRQAAIESLGHLRMAENLTFLSDLALSEPDEKLAKVAVGSVADIPGRDALETLKRIYRESDRELIRQAMVMALRQRSRDLALMFDFLNQAVAQDPSLKVQISSVKTMGYIKSVESLKALESLARSNLAFKPREMALASIARFPDDVAVPMLAGLLDSLEDARMRRSIVEILGDIGEDSAIPHLASAAEKDANTKVRQQAVKALGEIGSDLARDAILKVLSTKSEE